MPTRQEILEEKQRIEREHAERQRALEEQLEKSFEDDVAALRLRIVELSKERGMTVQAFVDAYLRNAMGKAARTVDKPKRGVEPPRYASPNDATVTWSGKGPKPAWFVQALKDGYMAREMLLPAPMIAEAAQ